MPDSSSADEPFMAACSLPYSSPTEGVAGAAIAAGAVATTAAVTGAKMVANAIDAATSERFMGGSPLVRQA
ncbi:hypothetical protein ACFWF3_37055 [Nocardia sp. NPDC060220]|uniref:hypothetical protein n=1 Tax=Nocardia sp. NPDC060220 TaxID=3347076 RepID=UPI00364D01D2